MKIKLTKGTVRRLNMGLQNYFKTLYEYDVIYITDTFKRNCFRYALNEMGYRRIFTDEDFYDTLDAYKELQETYQTLVYHHELYKKGKTPLDAFIGVCDGLSADELKLL